LDFVFGCYCKLPMNFRTYVKGIGVVRRTYHALRKFAGF